MKQINLKASNTTARESSGSAFSLVLGMVVLIASISAYMVVYYLNDKTLKEYDSTTADTQAKQAMLSDQKYKDLYYFEDRLVELKGKMADKSDQYANINKISSRTISTTTFNKLSMSQSKGETVVSAEISCQDNDELAKQLKSFIQADGFSDVKSNGSSVLEGGRVGSSITFKIK